MLLPRLLLGLQDVKLKAKKLVKDCGARLEKRMARLEKRLDTVSKAPDEKKAESSAKFESAKEKNG